MTIKRRFIDIGSFLGYLEKFGTVNTLILIVPSEFAAYGFMDDRDDRAPVIRFEMDESIEYRYCRDVAMREPFTPQEVAEWLARHGSIVSNVSDASTYSGDPPVLETLGDVSMTLTIPMSTGSEPTAVDTAFRVVSANPSLYAFDMTPVSAARVADYEAAMATLVEKVKELTVTETFDVIICRGRL